MQARILWVLGCTLALVLSSSALFFQDRNPGEYLVLSSRRKKGLGPPVGPGQGQDMDTQAQAPRG